MTLLRSTRNSALPTIVMAVGTLAAVVAVVGIRRRRRRRCLDHCDPEEVSASSCIYLDYNGTTPIYPTVTEAMMPYLTTHYGNPGSTHVYGDAPRIALQRARYQILKYLLACPLVEGDTNTTGTDDKIEVTPLSSCIFTSCGTEADNFIIHVALQQWEQNSNGTQVGAVLPHIVTTNVEHPAIDACLNMYETQGRCTVTRVPVQSDGRVRASHVIAAIQQQAQNTVLVTVMLANNETGAIQPVAEISQFCRQWNQNRNTNTPPPHHRLLFATDAAQATGKISVAVTDLGDPDLVVVVGHKFGAPKGIACLYIRPGCLSSPISSSLLPLQSPSPPPYYGLLVGGGQEYQWRGGTSNVPYIVGLGVAAQQASTTWRTNQQHMEEMRTRLADALIQFLGASQVRIHGPTDPQHRLPNTLSIGFGNGIDSRILLHELRNVVAASAGATCHSSATVGSVPDVSTILQAMQIPEDWARGTIRLSVGPSTTPKEVDRAAAYIAHAVQRQWNENTKN